MKKMTEEERRDFLDHLSQFVAEKTPGALIMSDFLDSYSPSELDDDIMLEMMIELHELQEAVSFVIQQIDDHIIDPPGEAAIPIPVPLTTPPSQGTRLVQ